MSEETTTDDSCQSDRKNNTKASVSENFTLASLSSSVLLSSTSTTPSQNTSIDDLQLQGLLDDAKDQFELERNLSAKVIDDPSKFTN